MAWTDPPSYTNGQIITQTDLHVGLRDNMRELDHQIAFVPFTSDVSTTTSIDVVSAGAITYAAVPHVIEFMCISVTFNSASAYLALFDGSTDLGIMVHPGAGGGDMGGTYRQRLTPTAASHTYKIVAVSAGGTTTTVRAGAGGPTTKMNGYIRIMAKGGA